MGKKDNKKKEELQEGNVEDISTEFDQEIQALKDENEALLASVETLKNDYFKAFADAENTKKRLERDYDLSMKYRIQTFALSILPAIDNLERALSQNSEDSNAYREGVKMIYDQIISALKAEGVVAIDALNKPFDANIHQALMVEETEGVASNIVIEELQKGYMIKDRVLRASLVKVSQ